MFVKNDPATEGLFELRSLSLNDVGNYVVSVTAELPVHNTITNSNWFSTTSFNLQIIDSCHITELSFDPTLSDILNFMYVIGSESQEINLS